MPGASLFAPYPYSPTPMFLACNASWDRGEIFDKVFSGGKRYILESLILLFTSNKWTRLSCLWILIPFCEHLLITDLPYLKFFSALLTQSFTVRGLIMC